MSKYDWNSHPGFVILQTRKSKIILALVTIAIIAFEANGFDFTDHPLLITIISSAVGVALAFLHIPLLKNMSK